MIGNRAEEGEEVEVGEQLVTSSSTYFQNRFVSCNNEQVEYLRQESICGSSLFLAAVYGKLDEQRNRASTTILLLICRPCCLFALFVAHSPV